MFLPEHLDPADPARTNHRGLFHAQWFLFFPLCALAAVAAAWRRPSRRVGAVVVLGMAAQLVLWLFTTHVQSRFLIPMAVTGPVVFGLATAALRREPPAESDGPRTRSVPSWQVAGMLAVLGAAAQGVQAVFVFSGQHGGRPNASLIDNAFGDFHSSNARAVGAARSELGGYAPADWQAAVERLTAIQFVNFVVPPEAHLYLLGDSAALYYRSPLIYHTTWDASPLGLVMRSSPGDPGAWTVKLRREGIDLVMVNFGELERLKQSGWYDPLVTPEAVADWLKGEGVLIRSWPETGQALFSISPTRPVAGERGAGH